MRLTETQGKVLRTVSKSPNGRRQIAGHGMAGYLSSARSLVRLGLLSEWNTSQFSITDKGRAEVVKHPRPPANKPEKSG
jgi:hypothetical protein